MAKIPSKLLMSALYTNMNKVLYIAKRLRCYGIFNDDFIENCLPSVIVKDFFYFLNYLIVDEFLKL